MFKIKAYNSITLLIFILSALFVVGSCSKAIQNTKPAIYITDSTSGLELTLKGSIEDADGNIKDIQFDWGDNSSNSYTKLNYAKINEFHVYKTPGNYTISIKTTDEGGEISEWNKTIRITFKETSLVNLKQSMKKVSPDEMLILTINLHTYQEIKQNEKFEILTDVIGKLDIDFVAFQECAQHKSSPIANTIIRTDNMAHILAANLKQKYNVDYNFTWNWAHYGWDVWEEGVAVFSKFNIINSDQRYISTNTSTTNIASRKVIFASFLVNGDVFNIFSAHTHWRTSETDQEQNNQINNIKQMVQEKETANAMAISFVCGDFNGNPTDNYPWNDGYQTMVQSNEYIDSFKEIYPDANNKPAQSKYYTIGGSLPGRIDYIFMKKNTRYKIVDSQIIFTPDIAGSISDHFGVLTKIKRF